MPAKKPVPQRENYAPAAAGGSGFGAMLLFLILAAAAFCAGLAVRYQKETGGSLIEAVRANSAVKVPPTPAVAPSKIAPAPDN